MVTSVKESFSIFRIAKKEYIVDNTGEGSFLYGGRWNPKGYRVVYAAESRSLALCEHLSNLGVNILLPNLYIVEIIIPEKISVLELSAKNFPEDWRKTLSSYCEGMGLSWLADAKTCIMKVPSAVIPEEYNYVINPLHSEAKNIKFTPPKKYNVDGRLLDLINKDYSSSPKE